MPDNEHAISLLKDKLEQQRIHVEFVCMYTIDEHGFKCNQTWGKNCHNNDIDIARTTYIQSDHYQRNNQYSYQVTLADNYTNIFVLNVKNALTDTQSDWFHQCCDEVSQTFGSDSYLALFSQYSNPAKRAEAINKILNRISNSEDILNDAESARVIGDQLTTIADCSNIIIARLSSDKKYLDTLYYHDQYDEPKFPFEVDPAFLNGSVTAFVAKFGKPIRGSSSEILSGLGVKTDEDFGIHSYDCLGVPIKTESSIFGAIIIQSYDKGFQFKDYVPGIVTLVAESLAHKAEQTLQRQHLNQIIESRTAELEQKNLELTKTITELQDTQNELAKSEAQAHLSKVVFKIAHYLNTPIGNATTGVSVMTDRFDAIENHIQNGDTQKLKAAIEDLRAACHLSISSIKKAANIINEFRRLASGTVEYEISTFRLPELMGLVESAARSKLADNAITFHHQTSDQIVTAHSGAIHEVLMCLIDNSIVHGFKDRSEGRITVEARINENQLIIHYQDDGQGVSPDMEHKMFELFESGSTTTSNMGLGLAIVQILVNSILRGSVDVAPDNQQGLAFDIRIPLTLDNTTSAHHQKEG